MSAADHPDGMTHLDASGAARMVDVGGKASTAREAVARGRIVMRDDVRTMLFDATLPKGDALAAARVAGIMAVKRTAELIPLCHPIATTHAAVTILEAPEESGAVVECTVRCTGPTGVEMEALTGVSVALLTLYDMLKGVQKDLEITGIHLVRKRGGRSGDYDAGCC